MTAKGEDDDAMRASEGRGRDRGGGVVDYVKAAVEARIDVVRVRRTREASEEHIFTTGLPNTPLIGP